ncbi:ly6/PLAUR domain-containing protein 2-like [Scyliorhinus canicula]|uniref:ly6/PLAUR domain-containing protein 2-like n=1 Tax=Scyliorhinus canicula TaxID=7830 RepID=UPI0018F6DB5F|nr:ly6/PLAUR domain-containing protein 2-like [Scyliorhinus canicula]XP_038635474.1 ly6/PLAUR domain-containing protein 2-like [Scyliorhinus canicula]XP_038635476.1 ly6/PLAUR domain-containing protein 2-like [Scyliorhinus canicula]
MKFITGAIIAALCSLTAEALKCYYCLNSRIVEECNAQHQICPSNKTMCLTSVKTIGFSQTGLGIVKVTKKCSYHLECNADIDNIILGGRKVLCCATDLCNADSAAIGSSQCWILLGSTAAITWTLLELTVST